MELMNNYILTFILFDHLYAGNRAVKGHEWYDTFSKVFAAPFCEINTLLEVGFIHLWDNRYPVELCFGGDMKVDTIIVVHS